MARSLRRAGRAVIGARTDPDLDPWVEAGGRGIHPRADAGGGALA
jgi:hypothetical protein